MTRPNSQGARRVADGLRPIADVDLVHGLDVDLPRRLDCPAVATVHDLSVFDVPWAFSRYRAMGERLIVARAIDRADSLIAVSSFTAERVEHHFGRTACVVPLAPRRPSPRSEAAITAVRQRYGLPERFVLQLASIEPRKDVELLTAACTALGIPLVLAGSSGGRPVPAECLHLGYVPADDVDPLLDAADIVAYASTYEGFGLPPLEAMARGRPVVASACGALPEVAAGGAELVPPGDLDQLERALGLLWADAERRADLGERGRRVASGLSWDATAAATLDQYRRLGVAV